MCPHFTALSVFFCSQFWCLIISLGHQTPVCGCHCLCVCEVGRGGSRAVCITEDNQWMTAYYPASKRLICLKPQMPTNPKCQSQMMWELVLARVKLPSCGVLGGGPGRKHLLLESAQPRRNTDQVFVLFVYPEDCHVCDHLRCGCCQK